MVERYRGGDMLAYFKLNEGIYDAIVAAAHNGELAAHRMLRVRVLHALYLPNIRPERWQAAVAEHQEFMIALARRDGSRLGRLLRAHKERTWDELRECLKAT